MDAELSHKATGPRSVLRVMDILLAVSGRPDGCTLTEISDALSLPKTSAFSLLKTLEAGGYLQLSQTRYRLGTQAVRLAASIGQAISFPRCARPILERLAADTGETIMLGALSDEQHEVAYLEVVESDAPLRFTVRTGNRRPLYCVAAGKAILAFLPRASRQAYLDKTEFVRFTDRTSTKAQLAGLLPEIAKRAVAIDADGIIDGATGIASPSFGSDGAVACAVTIAGPTGRLLGQQARFEDLTRRAGEEVSRLLGYRGEYPPPAP